MDYYWTKMQLHLNNRPDDDREDESLSTVSLPIHSEGYSYIPEPFSYHCLSQNDILAEGRLTFVSARFHRQVDVLDVDTLGVLVKNCVIYTEATVVRVFPLYMWRALLDMRYGAYDTLSERLAQRDTTAALSVYIDGVRVNTAASCQSCPMRSGVGLSCHPNWHCEMPRHIESIEFLAVNPIWHIRHPFDVDALDPTKYVCLDEAVLRSHRYEPYAHMRPYTAFFRVPPTTAAEVETPETAVAPKAVSTAAATVAIKKYMCEGCLNNRDKKCALFGGCDSGPYYKDELDHLAGQAKPWMFRALVVSSWVSNGFRYTDLNDIDEAKRLRGVGRPLRLTGPAVCGDGEPGIRISVSAARGASAEMLILPLEPTVHALKKAHRLNIVPQLPPSVKWLPQHKDMSKITKAAVVAVAEGWSAWRHIPNVNVEVLLWTLQLTHGVLIMNWQHYTGHIDQVAVINWESLVKAIQPESLESVELSGLFENNEQHTESREIVKMAILGGIRLQAKDMWPVVTAHYKKYKTMLLADVMNDIRKELGLEVTSPKAKRKKPQPVLQSVAG